MGSTNVKYVTRERRGEMGMKSMAAGILPVILVSLGLILPLGLTIPSAAAEEYEITVDRILKETVTFTEWVNDFLKALKLPK